MRKLNFWVPIQGPEWHTPIRPSIHLPPPQDMQTDIDTNIYMNGTPAWVKH